jgi:hypothetical protein
MSTPLAELRKLNMQKQKEATDEQNKEESNTADKSYDNMTSHMTDKQEIQEASKQVGKSEVLQDGHPAVKQVRKPSGKTAISPSVMQSIKATVQQVGETVPTLKTVTIKLSPDLDRKVETYCFETTQKKQDVVRDALLLYFETVEAIQRGEA